MLRNQALLAAVCWAAAATASADDPFAAVREKIQQALADGAVPSLTVAVARADQVLWEESFGWADRAAQRAATIDTPYSLASISKPVVATALMRLVERGAIELDQPADNYLGEAKFTVHAGDPAQVTIRRLANHTAGLPLHYQFFYRDEEHQPPEFDESMRHYGRIVFPPSERFQYANFGYGVLGEIVARRAGKPLADVLREEIFQPLNMQHSSLHLTDELRPLAAVRYSPAGQPLPEYGFDHDGASAVYCSARDLLRFGQSHLATDGDATPRLLTAASWAAMIEPTADANGGRHYSVGWFVDPDEFGARTISHTGGMPGVRTRLTLVPDQQLVVVALCNYSTDLPLRITREILAALLPEYRKRYLTHDEHQVNSQPGRPGCPPELVGYWAGEVATHEGSRRLELHAFPNGDVQVRLAGQLRTLVNQSRLRDGWLTGVFGGAIHVADANRRPHQLQLELKLRGDTMNGAVTALSLPADRGGNAISFWTELRRLDVDPEVVAAFNGHDLAGWRVLDKYDYERHGQVAVRDGQIVMAMGRPGTGIAWDGAPLRYDYELSLEAKRIEGSDFFCGLTFPVEQRYLTLILGGWGGGATGLSNINGSAAIENETSGFHDFQLGRWYRVKLRVTKSHINVWIDDQQIIDVDVTDKKLDIWWEQEPARPLGITSWYTSAALRDIRWKRLPE